MSAPARQKRVAVVTLGCKVNQFESAAFESGIAALGGRLVGWKEEADVYVVNSCAVTGKAAAESRRLIRRLARNHPDARIVVTGCYAQVAVDELFDLVDQPLCVVGNGFKHMLARVAMSEQRCDLEMYMGDISRVREAQVLHADSFPGRARAFLKVQEGCDSFCSYCIVPHARGPSRSLPPDEVLRQCGTFARAGFIELVITGIHTGAYGRDLSPPTSLAALLERLTTSFPALRFRISSLEPTEISGGIIELVAGVPGLRPHFHIPLQSGDDRVLERMNRRYHAADFAAVVEWIAGRVKEERVAILRELDHKKRTSFYRSCLGQTREVLAERPGPHGLRGFTDNYVPVEFSGGGAAGRLHRVRLERLEGLTVKGVAVD